MDIQNAMHGSQVVMEAGEWRAGVERDPQPLGDALGGRRIETCESAHEMKSRGNELYIFAVVPLPANMAGFSSIPRAHMTPSTPVAARTSAASDRERTSPLAKTGTRTA